MPRMSIAERLYRLLLRCYPVEFRDEYEREMLQAFHDRLGEDQAAGFRAVLRLWRQVLADAILLAPGEHLDVLGQDLRYAVRTFRRSRWVSVRTPPSSASSTPWRSGRCTTPNPRG